MKNFDPRLCSKAPNEAASAGVVRAACGGDIVALASSNSIDDKSAEAHRIELHRERREVLKISPALHHTQSPNLLYHLYSVVF